MNILDEYITDVPTAQNAINLFSGEWTSQFPDWAKVTAGTMGLYSDPRVAWAISALGGVRGMDVLELGPLEAAHTYMLVEAGAGSVLSIEANPRNYMKCLIAKEVLALRARFLLGDFNRFLSETDRRFDLCFCAGVLYHMVDPIQTLLNISKISKHLYIWTHYYDETILTANQYLGHYFDVELSSRVHGHHSYTYVTRNYREALETATYCGGIAPTSSWMLRHELLMVLESLGYADIQIEHEMPDHPHGPCFSILARKART